MSRTTKTHILGNVISNYYSYKKTGRPTKW